GSYLSGGLDSSSVSVIANELLREQGRAEPLDTFSLVYPGMSCDESEYIQATVEHAGLRSHLFPPIPPSMDYYHEKAARYQDFPGWPNGGAMMTLPLQEGLREAGTRVMLTGWGGNECVEGIDNDLVELSGEGRLLELVSEARARAANGGPPWWRLVFDFGVRPHIPPTVKRGLRTLLRGKRRFECLPLEFQDRTALPSRVEASTVPAGASPVQQFMYSSFYSGWATLFHEIWEREGAFLGIELRHPFFDRGLAEFAFAIPEQQRSHCGLVKIVLRNALQGRLPESVIRRRIQAEFTPIVRRAVDTFDAQGSLTCAAIAERGWIIPSELFSSIQKFRAGESLNVWRLWAPIGMEIWCHQMRQS
ncbi:MAG TPA: asparagine synthase C-terminal domain-containing protein, partial [Candidatus Sulfotelmatobacter sp.]